MKLYLVRHGQAVSETVDPERPLSREGKAEVRKVAGFLKSAGVKVPEILHSGKARARQTAEILASAVASGCSPRAVGGVAPNDPVHVVSRELVSRSEDLMLVGHFPHVARLGAFLLTGDETGFGLTFPTASVLSLECDERGSWTLAWMIVPELL
jgi:phosphohistidine phosphatase